MPDIDLDDLLKVLDTRPVPPPFATIRARRAARIRRLLAGAAVSVAVLLVVGFVGIDRGTRHNPPVAPDPTSSTVRTTGGHTSAGRAGYDTLTFTDDGWLYFLSDYCAQRCELGSTNPVFADVLYRSVDLGRHWQVVHSPDDLHQFDNFDGTEQLLVGSRQNLWIQDGVRLLTSTDGGTTWFVSGLPPLNGGGYVDNSGHPLGMVGRAAWFLAGGSVWVVEQPNATPRRLDTAPAFDDVETFTAVSDTRALLVTRSALGAMTWYVTDDQGAHWRPATNPCDPTGTDSVRVRHTAPDTTWAHCRASDQSESIYRSTDDGLTWQPLGPLPDTFGDLDPVSATVLWYGVGQHSPGVFRSTDAGSTWTPAGHGLPLYDGVSIFTAHDADVAVDVWEGGRYATVYVTTDGGATWHQAALP